MGYTHYIRNNGATKEDALNWIEHTNNLIIQYNKTADASDMIVSCGEESLKLSGNIVRVNGYREKGHETLYIPAEPRDFQFCKTARKPYDRVVCASYIIAQYLSEGRLIASSDGDAFPYDYKGTTYEADTEVLESIAFLKSIYPSYDLDDTIKKVFSRD